jgi:hypothetical protein
MSRLCSAPTANGQFAAVPGFQHYNRTNLEEASVAMEHVINIINTYMYNRKVVLTITSTTK